MGFSQGCNESNGKWLGSGIMWLTVLTKIEVQGAVCA